MVQFPTDFIESSRGDTLSSKEQLVVGHFVMNDHFPPSYQTLVEDRTASEKRNRKKGREGSHVRL